MGILDRFRKEETIHYERDKSGRVVSEDVIDVGQLKRARREQEKLERHRQARERKQEYRQAYQESFHKGRLERERKRGRAAGLDSFGDKLERITRPPRRTYTTRNNYNPFGTMFDTGMKKPRKKRTKRKKPYRSKQTKGFEFDMTDNWGLL